MRGRVTALPDMRIFLIKRFKMEGFIVSDHMDLWPKAIGELVVSRRRQETDLARDDPRRPRKCPPGANRPLAWTELRQDAGEGRLGLTARLLSQSLY